MARRNPTRHARWLARVAAAPREDPSLAMGVPFTIAVGPASGNDPVQELTSFGQVAVRMNYTDGDQIDFSIDGRSPERYDMDELATDVWLFGPIEQRFRISTMDQTWDADGGDLVTVKALSYKHLLAARHVQAGGLAFTDVDQGDIVWGMYAHTQATVGGNWRVTRGNVVTGQKRDRTYVEGDNLGDLAKNVQDVINGLWWDVNGELVLNASLHDAFPLAQQPIELGVNCRGLSRKSSAAMFGNAVYVDADTTTTPVWAEAPDLATDPRGRWEVARGFPTTELQETLSEHALGLLDEVNTPLSAWTIEIEPARYLTDSLYLPGDFVVVVVPTTTAAPLGPGAALPERTVQVSEVALGFDGDGATAVSISANEVGPPGLIIDP